MIEDVRLDSMHRIERAGFAAYSAGPLVRQAFRGYNYYREVGHFMLAEPFTSTTETPDAVLARSPKLRALTRYAATHARSRLPFSAADRSDISDGGAAMQESGCAGGCVWGTCC